MTSSLSPLRHALRGALTTVAALTSTLWLLGACCNPLGGECIEDDDDTGDAGPEEPKAEAIGNCDVEAIVDGGNETCATCAGDDGDAVICGEVVTARCESRENSFGDSCSICQTDLGAVLYDSCVGTDPIDVAFCDTSEPDRPDPGGGNLPPDDNVVCERCFDSEGFLVSETCEPAHDECDVGPNENGIVCRVCTLDGQVVVNACEQPDITPRQCEAYGNEAGSCVDCYGEEDELLTHFCTLGPSNLGEESCTDYFTADGALCHECFDANGVQTKYSCQQVDPTTLEQCALLDYAEQSCIICLSDFGEVALLSCGRKGCDPALEECAPPPICAIGYGENGETCRTCPNDAGDLLETECVVETSLVCAEQFDEFTGTQCVSCADLNTGVEVFYNCDGTIPPPCFEASNAAGDVCLVCLDPEGEEFYANCPSQLCFDTGLNELHDPNGGPLFLDDDTRAVASCTECSDASNVDGTGQDFQASCTLRSDCGTDLTNPEAACDGTVTFRVRPLLCNNPWEQAGFSVGATAGSAEILQVMSYALDSEASVAVVAVQHSGANAVDVECADECGCARGDILDVVVLPNDAAATVGLFEGILQPCQSDADCSEGATCRLADGGCG